jgi:hypothetical protein
LYGGRSYSPKDIPGYLFLSMVIAQTISENVSKSVFILSEGKIYIPNRCFAREFPDKLVLTLLEGTRFVT